MIINIFGDICLQGIDSRSFGFDKELLKEMELADLNIGNLENPITSSKKEISNHLVHLKSDEWSLDLLSCFDIFSLANNHICDYRSVGLWDTVEAIEKKGLKYFGVGKTRKEAISPLIVEKDDIKISLIGATRFANTGSRKPGTAPDSVRLLKPLIRDLKKQKCFVVLYFHWGYEYVRYPSPRERSIARKCIDAGADLIIGAHPHIYQGIEKYKGKMIFYSLGNFIFDFSQFNGLSYFENDERLNNSFFVSINFKEDYQYDFDVKGYFTDSAGVRLYSKEENHTLKTDIKSISDCFYQRPVKYLNKYYQQAKIISEQNIKIRKDFMNIDEMPFLSKLKIYAKANSQDLKNRLYNLVIR